MKSPVSSSSDATDAPTMRGRKYETPTSQAESPRRMKAAFMRADSPAMRTSEASASAKPPPDAAPCTAAMIGCGARRISITSSAMWRCPRSAAGDRRRCAPSSPARLLQIEPGAEGAARAAQHAPRASSRSSTSFQKKSRSSSTMRARQRVQRVGAVQRRAW